MGQVLVNLPFFIIVVGLVWLIVHVGSANSTSKGEMSPVEDFESFRGGMDGEAKTK